MSDDMDDMEQYYVAEIAQLREQLEQERERAEESIRQRDDAIKAHLAAQESAMKDHDLMRKYSRALWRWRHRAWNAERAIKRAVPLLEPIFNIHARIEQLSYGGPPSPLLAVRSEAGKAHEAYEILKEVQDEREAARRGIQK